jgi:cytochrome b involved in lipid metabolism
MNRSLRLILITLALWLLGNCAAEDADAQRISAADLANHNTAASCWIKIDEKVYDVSGYLSEHRRLGYDLGQWCGRDASNGWRDKDGRNQAHSRRAALLLRGFEIGQYAP